MTIFLITIASVLFIVMLVMLAINLYTSLKIMGTLIQFANTFNQIAQNRATSSVDDMYDYDGELQ
jgi:hypothetical protein